MVMQQKSLVFSEKYEGLVEVLEHLAHLAESVEHISMPSDAWDLIVVMVVYVCILVGTHHATNHYAV